MDNTGYNWKFTSVGGAVRVKIDSGADIAHLGELDRKMWTVLSSPVKGLEFDEKTLALIDANGDGTIRVDEVIATAQWLTGILKNPDLLLKGDDTIALSEFNTENENGAKLLGSAKQILVNLGLEKDSISLEDTSDNVKIFANSIFNGDGIITPASAEGDEALAALITTISEKIGKSMDRSGVEGVTADNIEAFYTACADFDAWKEAAAADKDNIFPYGDNTAAALAACDALKDKIADYFMRCKLIAFDNAVSDAVDVSADKIVEISGENLSIKTEEIAKYPLFRPDKDALLPLKGGINPAWKGAFDTLKATVLDVDFPDADSITEEQWNAILGKFGPFTAWTGAKKGAEVEGLGDEEIKKILKEDRKADLLALIDKDKALEEEALSIESVDKFMRLYKNFYRFLNNYVVLSDFYDSDHKAIFQAGRLYIDQRSTDLCIKVEDMGKHAGMANLSGMYILYCACTSKVKNATMNIAAVLTDGDVDSLRVGKNAVFYDRDGVDWSATVTNIVENPISLRQAFWSPYKKASRMISDKIGKAASDKANKGEGTMTSITESATSKPADGVNTATKAAPFDIGKIAGITIAIAAVGGVLTAIIAVLKSLTWWQWIILIVGLMLIISLPSVFIAWRKLRKRDLGPMLNANGWAINASALVRTKFGATLTSLVKYPKLTAVDPKARKKANLKRFIWTLVCLIVLAGGFLYFTDRLSCIGLPYHKEKVEVVEEAPEAVTETPAEIAPEADVAPEGEPA